MFRVQCGNENFDKIYSSNFFFPIPVKKLNIDDFLLDTLVGRGSNNQVLSKVEEEKKKYSKRDQRQTGITRATLEDRLTWHLFYIINIDRVVRLSRNCLADFDLFDHLINNKMIIFSQIPNKTVSRRGKKRRKKKRIWDFIAGPHPILNNVNPMKNNV